ncbi:cytochrome c3 family protein [Desulfobacterales bacterium HSG2]|nr:cytochrome c3 family protein [Desulfobacterales bacterium HSG2]
MKKKSLLIIAVIVGMVTLFVATGIYAGTEVKDEFEMKADYKHKKGIVKFTHKKHNVDYKIGCGDCHHVDKDKDGKPEKLDDLKMGDPVQKCIECHAKPGEIKGKKAKGMKKPQKREYHANAVHDNCIGCHKDYNKKNKTKAAPKSCKKCHPKKKK